ncbi:MAG: HAMP domain-containing histidine kinase [Gammaproteobacteria bacterium]|nr:HAMP domain-containing histidine kinase [Gammaproteobacteria bacterium]
MPLANIAHEIRNPLGAISYAAQLLSENNELGEAEQRMTEIIHQHSQRINHIIEDILRISRGSPTAMLKLDLLPWLEKFVSDFHMSNQPGEPGIELKTTEEQALIMFDPGHLSRIMTNLCSNALIHGNPGKPVHIKVHYLPQRVINIEIADEGPGIEQEDMDKIFEPFFTTSHHGSGLGLYIVNQLCELNNAAISVHKNLYNGTSFIIQPNLPKPEPTKSTL